MAATKGRLTKTQQDQVREAIRATQLVKRLQFFALGEKDPSNPEAEIKLTAEQLRAIDMLLKKAVPDLQAVTINGEVGMHVTLANYTPRL